MAAHAGRDEVEVAAASSYWPRRLPSLRSGRGLLVDAAVAALETAARLWSLRTSDQTETERTSETQPPDYCHSPASVWTKLFWR